MIRRFNANIPYNGLTYSMPQEVNFGWDCKGFRDFSPKTKVVWLSVAWNRFWMSLTRKMSQNMFWKSKLNCLACTGYSLRKVAFMPSLLLMGMFSNILLNMVQNSRKIGPTCYRLLKIFSRSDRLCHGGDALLINATFASKLRTSNRATQQAVIAFFQSLRGTSAPTGGESRCKFILFFMPVI